MNKPLFKARLPNGMMIKVPLDRKGTPSETTAHKAKERLMGLLDSPQVSEAALVDFLLETGRATFPAADPAKPLEYQHGMTERGMDCTYSLVNSNDLGIIEILHPRYAEPTAIASRIQRMKDYALTLAEKTSRRVAEAHVIAGREGTLPAIDVPDQLPFKLDLVSWDDIADRLISPGSTDEESHFAVIVEHILESSRYLLSLIANNP
jgi:hypothetical protein